MHDRSGARGATVGAQGRGLTAERGHLAAAALALTSVAAPMTMCTFEYLANRMTFDGVTTSRLVDELAGKVDRVVADGTARLRSSLRCSSSFD
jgi:hypothetical protein